MNYDQFEKTAEGGLLISLIILISPLLAVSAALVGVLYLFGFIVGETFKLIGKAWDKINE